MLNQFSRTQLLLGQDGMERLFRARVAVFGIGGVGGYTVEALARSGVGTLDLIDDDRVCLTNVNRQIFATRKTVGQYKVDVAEARIKEINPDAVVHTYKTFYAPQTADQFDFTQYDYVVDAIDTVTGKLELIQQAQQAGTPIISCMGAGNKMDASAFEVADIYQTSVCPGPRHAPGTEAAGHQKAEGGLFQGAAHDASGRYVHQLPDPLHLPAGNGPEMHPAAAGPRQQRLCACRGGADCGGRGGKGPDHGGEGLMIYLDYSANTPADPAVLDAFYQTE